jgi:hypothetical protein
MNEIYKILDTADPKKQDQVKHLPIKFEHKREYHWAFEIDGIDSFLFARFTRPYYDGVTKAWRHFTAQLYDPVAPSGAQQIFSWIKEDCPRDCSIKLLSSKGDDVVEEWTLKDTVLVAADFGSLNYSSSECIIITLTLSAGTVILKY